MATTISGTVTTWGDTARQVRIVLDAIPLISPVDTPLIARFGLPSAPPMGWEVSGWPGKKLEWFERDLAPDADQLDGSITDTATTITVDAGSTFRVGDRVLIDSEQLRVSAVNTSTQVLTVARAQGGSTAASHADNAVVTKFGNAQLEGADSNEGRSRTVDNPYNVIQIFENQAKVTDLERMIRQYGVEDALQMRVEDNIKADLKLIEKGLYIGGRQVPTDNTTAYGMGSLDYYINVSGGNTVSAGGAVTEADFLDVMQAIYLDGGNPRLALMSPANKRAISNLNNIDARHIVTRTENKLGFVVDGLETDFGQLEFMTSRLMPSDRIFILDPDHYSGPITLQPPSENGSQPYSTEAPFQGKFLGETGAASAVMTQAIVTQIVRYGSKAHGAIIGIS